MSDRWEYKILTPTIKGMGMFGTAKRMNAHFETALNELGRNGWDCYGVKFDAVPPTFYLKRKI
jgi:hypothetical protein